MSVTSPVALVAANHFGSFIFQAMSSASQYFCLLLRALSKSSFQLNSARFIYLSPAPKNSGPVLTPASVSSSLEPQSGALCSLKFLPVLPILYTAIIKFQGDQPKT